MSLKDSLAPLAAELQFVYYDQRGHGRSDYSSAEYWNLPTWAGDLRGLCDVLGIDRPVVLGSSFGGFVALTYAGLFPEHPGGLILTNTTGGRTDYARSIEVFRRIGGDEAAAVAARDFSELTAESAAEFDRVCHPLFSSQPGFVEESKRRLSRAIHSTEVNLHYWRHESDRFDPWTLLSEIVCPVLVLAGTDDPMCPIELVEDLVDGFNGTAVQLVELDGARHAVFRDQPDKARAAVLEFVTTVADRP
jgi:proline iminopeptidase